MRIVQIFLIAVCFSNGWAQRLSNIDVSLVNGQNQTSGVLVRFSILPGIACPGYEIQHSLDSLNFYAIQSYGGICGNQTNEENYSYLHTNPTPNAVNYYRVTIPGYETSNTYRIFVGDQVPSPGILVYPNPMTLTASSLKFILLNYSGTSLDGYIYNQKGQKIKPLSLSINQNQGEFSITDLDDGLFVVWLTDGDRLFRSKFIIKRP